MCRKNPSRSPGGTAHQVAREHFHPVTDALLAFQWSRAVEEGGVGHLQPGSFQ
jgi:hypothetical protein